MSLARHIAAEARLRTELNEALRERDTARGERNAARLVVSSQADAINSQVQQIAYLSDERSQLDAAHRAALADLAEAYRELAQARLDLFNERDHVPVAEPVEAVTLHESPDMDRCG
ncbi:hypothetical protein SEA_AMGINE_46 [Mycobacterium phage Amgine]|uniref:Uncharacterized protein n=1 Tax=Mycobacterium phage Amgine TaxID=2015817 RepID=A0A222ZLP1_9CAUD|nr:hypothetical protein I5G84_gp46 [Mycobacterium phage Amgine]ASR85647.1 hypothetical protein SEA_AMGINE_46 [Mycobacterium phage Amgine]